MSIQPLPVEYLHKLFPKQAINTRSSLRILLEFHSLIPVTSICLAGPHIRRTKKALRSLPDIKGRQVDPSSTTVRLHTELENCDTWLQKSRNNRINEFLNCKLKCRSLDLLLIRPYISRTKQETYPTAIWKWQWHQRDVLSVSYSPSYPPQTKGIHRSTWRSRTRPRRQCIRLFPVQSTT